MWPNMSSCSAVIDAVGDLDPHHLVVAALALAVDAVVQAEDPEDVLVDLTGEVGGDGALEPLDVTQLLGVEIVRGSGDDGSDAHGGLQIPTDPLNNSRSVAGRLPDLAKCVVQRLRRRLVRSGSRWATSPAPGRPISSTVSTIRGSPSS